MSLGGDRARGGDGGGGVPDTGNHYAVHASGTGISTKVMGTHILQSWEALDRMLQESISAPAPGSSATTCLYQKGWHSAYKAVQACIQAYQHLHTICPSRKQELPELGELQVDSSASCIQPRPPAQLCHVLILIWKASHELTQHYSN